MKNFVVILPNIRSLYNVGSIFRTADALKVDKIYLTGYTGRPDREPKISKTALGADKTVSWEHIFQTTRLTKKLRVAGYQIIALEITPKSISYKKFQPNSKIALIVGNEVRGLSKGILSQCDVTLKLPMLGKKESLNVSVAFGIIGYHFRFN